MSSRLDSLRPTLEEHDQTHLLRFADRITAVERDTLADQILAVDFIALKELIALHVNGAQEQSVPADVTPAPYYACPLGKDALSYDPEPYLAAGEASIRAGKVAAFTVAGGQGTRLGWRGPKGTYPATVVTGKPLFRCFAEQILCVERKYGVAIPWYIMTSPANHAETRSFFLDNNCFGLVRKNIFMFPQGMMPSLDAESGRILLAEPHVLALNPDGHGGSIKALRRSGAIEDMKARGIEHISYFQVDNPLVRAVDPLFIGLHTQAPDSSGEMSSKMVAKTDPGEKVGVFCHGPAGDRGGKTMVIEYSDLPDALAQMRDGQGDLRYRAGSIAIHLIGVGFVERLTAEAHRFALPYHRAVKKVGHVDPETGGRIEPETPNAIKLETFVFDALGLAQSSIVLETDRAEEFAPIKNATGNDSPQTSHQIQSNRAGRWLEAHGVNVARGGDGNVAARIEISPLTAEEPSDLVAIDLPETVVTGEELVL